MANTYQFKTMVSFGPRERSAFIKQVYAYTAEKEKTPGELIELVREKTPDILLVIVPEGGIWDMINKEYRKNPPTENPDASWQGVLDRFYRFDTEEMIQQITKS